MTQSYAGWLEGRIRRIGRCMKRGEDWEKKERKRLGKKKERAGMAMKEGGEREGRKSGSKEREREREKDQLSMKI